MVPGAFWVSPEVRLGMSKEGTPRFEARIFDSRVVQVGSPYPTGMR